MPGQLTRREFIKSVGGVTGGVTANRVIPEIKNIKIPFGARIAVLVPDAPLYKNLRVNLIGGMRVYQHQNTHKYQLGILEKVIKPGYMDALKNTREAIAQGVQVVVGYFSAEVAARLGDTFDDANVVLIVVNAGADWVRAADYNPFVFYNSLRMWQANWAFGNWAASNIGNSALIATSFYDCGFESLNAFQEGFEVAGGRILSTYISDAPPLAADPSLFLETINQVQPDFIFGSFCGPAAKNFVRNYLYANVDIPLLGSAFTFSDKLVTKFGGLEGTLSAFSWSSSLKNPENKSFIKSYKKLMGRYPDALGLLGYETARMIAEAVHMAGDTNCSGNQLAMNLKTTQFDSPRGDISIDPDTHQAKTPLYLLKVINSGKRVVNIPLKTLDEPFYDVNQAPKTGWLNAYLS
jgi:branched-chain amino acid transport system substrate-binding protein